MITSETFKTKLKFSLHELEYDGKYLGKKLECSITPSDDAGLFQLTVGYNTVIVTNDILEMLQQFITESTTILNRLNNHGEIFDFELPTKSVVNDN